MTSSNQHARHAAEDDTSSATTDHRRGDLGRQVTFLAVARLSTVVAFFGVSVVSARLLTPAEVGSAAIGQTIGILAALLANGGLNIAAVYFLQRRPDDRASTVGRLIALAAGAGALAVLLALALAPLVVVLVFGEPMWPLFVAAAAMAAAMIGFEFGGALLLGLGRPGPFTWLEFIRGWGSLLAVVVLLLGPVPTDYGLVLGLGLGYAAAATMGLLWTRRAGMPLKPRYDRAFAGEALRFGIRGQIGNVFQFLGVRLDLIIVPALLGLQAAGIYFIAVRVSEVIGQVPTAAASLIFPRVAGQADRGSTALTERTVRLTLLFVLAAAVVLGLFSEALLRFAFGPAYAAGSQALTLLFIATIPLAAGRILAADLKGRGHPGMVSAAAAISILATVVFDLALVPSGGIVGAAIASILTYTLTTLALLVAYRAVTRARLLLLVPRVADIGDLLGATRRLMGRREVETH